MKIRKVVEIEHKPKYKEIEVEVWECPKCKFTFFRREAVFQFEKRENEIYRDTWYRPPMRMGLMLACAKCGAIVWSSLKQS